MTGSGVTVLLHTALPGAGCGGWRRRAGLGRLAVDDVLLFRDREPARARDVGLHRDEHHLAGAALLDGDVLDRRLAPHLVADPQIARET